MQTRKTIDHSSKSTNGDARIRRFLTYSLTGLILALLFTYIWTRNDAVLAIIKIFAIAQALVYPYYFRRRRRD
jgi:hypothetical protein